MTITKYKQLEDIKFVHINDGEHRYFASVSEEINQDKENTIFFTPVYFFTENKDLKKMDYYKREIYFCLHPYAQGYPKVKTITPSLMTKYAEMFL